MSADHQINSNFTVSEETSIWVSEVRVSAEARLQHSDTQTELSGYPIKKGGFDNFISLQNTLADRFDVAYQLFRPGILLSIEHLHMVVRH